MTADEELAREATVERFRSMSLRYSEKLLKTDKEKKMDRKISIPIEKILIHSSPIEGSVRACASWNNSVVVAVSLGKSVFIMSFLEEEHNNFQVQFDSTISSLLFASESLLILFTDDLHIILIDLESGEEILRYPFSLGGDFNVAPVMVSSHKFVVTSACNALYLVTFSAGPPWSMNHQLLIASSASSLGNVLDLRYNEAENLLAVLAQKSLIILHLDQHKPPSLAYKLAFPHNRTTGGPSCISSWLGCPSLVLFSSNEYFLISSRSSSPGASSFTQTRMDVEHSHPVVPPFAMHAVGANAILLEEQHADLRRKIFHLVQIDLETKKIQFLSNAEPFLLPPSSLVLRSRTPTSSFTVVSNPNKKLELHKVSVMKWMEIIHSLVHCEQFDQAMDLMAGLKEGSVPSLTDRNEDLEDSFRGEGMIILCKKILKSEDLNLERFAIFASKFSGLLDQFLDPYLISILPSLVISGTIPVVPCLTQTVVSRVVDSMELRRDDELDVFLAKVVLENGPQLIDTNKIIRLAAALDLKLTTVLLHIYLLHDTFFPLNYLDHEEKLFYVFSMTRGLRYPCWDAPHAYQPPFAKLLLEECRSDFLQTMMKKENQDVFLDSIGFDMSLFTFLSKGHEVVSDALIVFGIKAAITETSLPEFFNNKIPQKNCIEILLRNGEIKLLLKCLDFVHRDSDLLQIILNELLLANSTDCEIELFLSKFGGSLQLGPVTNLLIKNNKPHLAALSMFAERRDFDSAVKIIHQIDHKLPVLVKFTSKFSHFLEPSCLVPLWAACLGNTSHLTQDVKDLLLAKVDLISLVQACSDIQIKSKLIELIHCSLDLLQHASNLNALDVGEQFSSLAKQDSMRNKGISITATICHVCLDPICDSKRTDILLFSCGHIIHSSCGDSKICSVCV